MSDSLPPHGGPDPWDGRDLEGVLSGEPVWLPEGMRPVASTLAALRSSPLPAELAGEAAARATFRQLMNAGGARQAPRAAGPADSPTVILPARTADAGPRGVTRPRHAHRRPPRRGGFRPVTLIGAGGAAAIVIAGGIALAGGFSGGGQPGQSGHRAASAAPRTSHPGLSGVEGSGTKAATASPTPSSSGSKQSSSPSAANPGPAELCRQYLDSIAQPGSRPDSAGFQQLSSLAGGPWHVTGYCMRLQPWSKQSDSGGLGFPPADSQDSAGNGGPQGQNQGQGGNPQPGDIGNGFGSGFGGGIGNGIGDGQGNAGNGNGNGAKGSAAGDKKQQ